MPHEFSNIELVEIDRKTGSSMVFAPGQLANVYGRKNHCIILLPVMRQWFAGHNFCVP
jgi:hypothetical protein